MKGTSPTATLGDQSTDDQADPLLRALARTPEVAPFTGTDRYRVCSCLGEGGFGVVYEVEDRELGRRLALKTLKPDRRGFAADIRRLKREFRAAADLVHPNLVGLHDLSSAGPRWFFTMDLVRGVDFLAHVRPDGVLSEARLRDALRQVVVGVDALHRVGMVHRDLKPSNVLVEPGGRVVILDFGLADRQVSTDPELLRAGTPVYMAPEQAAGEPTSAAADWYAVGVMVHQALTGSLPVRPAGTPAERTTRPLVDPRRLPTRDLAAVGEAPDDLRELCERLLRAAPAERPDGREVLAALGAPIAAASARGGRREPFVGRTRELAVLLAAYDAVRTGEPRLARVHGQPGVGKSALLAQFLEEIEEEGRAAILTGRCHEREALPFKALDGVADSLVRYLRSLPRSKASGLMPRDIHLVVQLFPVFEGVAAVRDVPRRPAPLADPRETRRRAFVAIKELCARIADKQPLVIAIDDLQWGDVDSARLLAQLVAAPERPTMLLVLSYREGDAVHGSSLRQTLDLLEMAGERGVDLPVQPLPAADAEELAACLLDRAGRSGGDDAQLIAQRGEGHPLFMAELARALIARDEPESAPPALMDILWQRVARLSEGARALLEMVAVAGRPLPSHLCFEAAGLHGAGVDVLRLLRAEQLVRASQGGEINVFHDRIRDAILSRADAARQRRRHLALARSLERRAGADPEALARHFDAARLPRDAARHALRAADAAMKSLAFERAAALYQLALDRGDATGGAAAALHEKLGLALVNAGRGAPAGRAFLAAAALCGEGAHAIDLTRLAAEHLLALGDVEAGSRALDEALAAVRQVLPASLAGARRELLVHLARVRLRRTRFRQRSESTIPRRDLLRLDVLDSAGKGLFVVDPVRALAARARHYRMALDVGEPHRAALGMIGAVEGIMAFQSTRPALIDHVLDRAEEIGRRLDDPGVLGGALLARGKSHFVFGDWRRGAELCERAAAFIGEQCVGMAREQREAMLIASTCRIRSGDLAAAQRMGEALLLDTIERGDQVTEKQVCAGILAPLRLMADGCDEAEALLARVAREDRCASVIIYLESTAATAAYRGRTQDAIETWRSRWGRIQEMGVLAVGGFRVIVARSYGVALLADPRGREHLELARRMTRSLRRLRFPHAVAAHALLSACLALRSGARARAHDLLAEAAALFDGADMALEAAACRYRRGELLGQPGDAALAAADRALRAGGVVNPERWVRSVVPGPP